jgi:hypothetical protein
MIRTVKELIAALKQCDQDALIIVETGDGDLFYPKVDKCPSGPVTTGADYHRIGTTIAHYEIGLGDAATFPWKPDSVEKS